MHVATLLNSSFLSQFFCPGFFWNSSQWEFLICLTNTQDWLQTGGTWASAAWLSQGCFPPGLLQGSLCLCIHDNRPAWGSYRLLYFHNAQWVMWMTTPSARLQWLLLSLDIFLISEISGFVLYHVNGLVFLTSALAVFTRHFHENEMAALPMDNLASRNFLPS